MADTKTTKKPADHQPPAPRFQDVPGHDLLKPMSQVRGSDQARLMARLADLGLLSDDGGDAPASLDLDAAADLIDYTAARFALDQDAFEAFTMGAGGMERALNLVLSYAGELGKGE